MTKKIKVLIVDDSILFRQYLKGEMSKDPSIEIVGFANDPYEARDLIIKTKPDVMTLDIELPKMDGITFLKRLMPQYPMPVVVISSLSDKVFDALDNGALEFINKPSMDKKERFVQDLLVKVKIASIAKMQPVIKKDKGNVASKKILKTQSEFKVDMIAVGASTGGVEAFETILKGIDYQIPPMLLVQHMPKGFTKMYAKRLNDIYPFTVKEAENGDLLKDNTIYIAPGEKHMRVEKSQLGYRIGIFESEKVNGHRPSCDVLFFSCVRHVKEKVLGIILTGMGHDGAKGMLELKKIGAYTIGQDESTSVVYGMPKVAYTIGGIDKQLKIEDISNHILRKIK